MNIRIAALVPLLAAAFGGCYFDENLTIENLVGTVVLPEAAATRVITDADGVEQTVTDVRLIGPVVLGLYSGVSNDLYDYPHPTVGPSFQEGIVGDTYPYGGTTVGDIRFACLSDLTCKMTSGRHLDFQSIVDWSRMTGNPLTDAFGTEITSGDYLRDICYDILELSTDAEARLTQTDDTNGDGTIDSADLDFVQRSDGKFEASFTIWQQEFFSDPASGQGFTLWGWHDSPSIGLYALDTCASDDGYNRSEYNEQFYGGRQQRDLLNSPSQYINPGDWVSSVGFEYGSVDDIAEIELDMLVESP